MKILITEALKLRNDLTSIINSLHNQTNRSKNVKEYEKKNNNELIIISEPTPDNNFSVLIEKLKKAMDISFELNNSIALFNKESKIEEIVRKMKNSKLLLNIYKSKLSTSNEIETPSFTVVGAERVLITKVVKAIESATAIKQEIKRLSKEIRELEAIVAKANLTEITVSFEYDAVDELSF